MRKNDARNKLFYHFFRLVSEVKPLFFVVENVPGILGEKYDTLREESLSLVRRKYEMLDPIELSAGDFGAATTRSRVFFIGWAKDSGLNLSPDSFVTPILQSKVSVRMAFAGLPNRISPDWQTEEMGWQKIDAVNSTFFKAINQIPSDTIGDKMALHRFTKHREVSGFLGTRHSPDLKARYAGLKPGGVDEITKSRRLEWNGQCPTLRAGTGPERGSFQAVRPIHPSQGRVIVPREAARLQGFPDCFNFRQRNGMDFVRSGIAFHLYWRKAFYGLLPALYRNAKELRHMSIKLDIVFHDFDGILIIFSQSKF